MPFGSTNLSNCVQQCIAKIQGGRKLFNIGALFGIGFGWTSNLQILFSNSKLRSVNYISNGRTQHQKPWPSAMQFVMRNASTKQTKWF